MFREKIKMAIGAKNLRVCQVATECGIVSTSMSSYLNGSRGLKYDQLEKLVANLGLTLNPKKAFRFHSDFIEQQEAEREAKIAARQNE